MIVTAQQTSHWYTKEGLPAYGADLRTARKDGLYPSVTTIMSVLSKPSLEAWKQEQAILSALTLPMGEDETYEAFAHRVVEDSKEQSRTAADIGTALHDVAEKYLKDEWYTMPEGYDEVAGELVGWLQKNVETPIEIESTFTNLEHGYGGRIDLIAKLFDGRTATIDFKTQNVRMKELKSGPKPYPVFYEEWPAQLAAYSMGRSDVCMSVIISTNKDCPQVFVKEWDGESMINGWRMFLSCLTIWRIQKKYFQGAENAEVL